MSSKSASEAFYIKEGYISRKNSFYFEDALVEEQGIIHQPFVYPLASLLGKMNKSRYIIDIGCGRGFKLASLHPQFQIIGVDFGKNIEFCREHYPFGEWIDFDLEGEDPIPIEVEKLSNSIVICSDVIEHMVNPIALLSKIKWMLNYASVCIITTPERDLVRGIDDNGPPANLFHVREWNLAEFESLIKASSFNVNFVGLTVNNNLRPEKKTSIAILGNNFCVRPSQAPPGFRVVAFMSCFNEEDIIERSITYLIEQGIEIYLLDNWSTDRSCQIAQRYLGKGVLGVEKIPPDLPPKYYKWNDILTRVEELASDFNVDWFIHHDVDEIRESPWPGCRLIDAIHYVDQLGFNAIDHTVINFVPIDNGYTSESDFVEYFKYFEFGKKPGCFRQIKTWKKRNQRVSLASSGGHDVTFNDRRVYPYKFLLRHYPVRSQLHGEKKIHLERKQRYHPSEKAAGWHSHYDHMNNGHQFLRSPSELLHFDETFYSKFLVERLSGIGIL